MHSPLGDSKKGRAAYKCSKCGKSKKGHTCEVGSSLVFHSTVHDVQHTKTKQQLEKHMRELESRVTRLQQENAYLRLRLREVGYVQGDNLPLGTYSVPFNGLSYPSFGTFPGYSYDQSPEAMMGSFNTPTGDGQELGNQYPPTQTEMMGYSDTQSYPTTIHTTDNGPHLLSPYQPSVTLQGTEQQTMHPYSL